MGQCAPIGDVGAPLLGREVAAMDASEVIQLLMLVLTAMALGAKLKK